MATPREMIKIALTDRGEDTETPWAEDLGPADDGPAGSRRVRLANIPFLHAKPTYGDVLVVSPPADRDGGDDGFLTWDRDGVPWRRIGSRIAEDSGNWAMIVDYTEAPGGWEALREACDRLNVACEGAWGPRDDQPGRAYLAVAAEVDAAAIMRDLRAASLPCELIQIHPKPAAKPKARPKKPKAKARSKAKTPAKAKPAKKPKRSKR